jgi:AcrR family transcriptional regulator
VGARRVSPASRAGARLVEGGRSRQRASARGAGVALGSTGAVRGKGIPRAHIAEIQRSRLLAAAVEEFDERGYVGTTIAHITDRARVSRRTFYDLFAGREECLTAVLEGAVSQVERELAAANLEGLSWRERVRGGLWVILSFLEYEQALARVCVVQTLSGGSLVLGYREEILARLAAAVDEGRCAGGARGAKCSSLTEEGVLGAAFAILYARLRRREVAGLTGLLGELMEMIVLPYLGPAAARSERTRRAPKPLVLAVTRPLVSQGSEDPLEGLTIRLTYRTAMVLEGVREYPGASNRQVADSAGIHDQGQISKLLRRLESVGLVANTGTGAHARGEANAWALTSKGQRIAQSIGTCVGMRQAAA